MNNESHSDPLSPRGEHVVELHQNDEALVKNVAAFAKQGLSRNEKVLLVGSSVHLAAITAILRSGQADPSEAMEKGQLVMFDGDETLSRFMVDGMPDWQAFREAVGGIVRGLTSDPVVPLRIWGEMVNSLWRQSNVSAAVRLEQMWNQLAGEFPFFLYCTYIRDPFAGEKEMPAEIFTTHSCSHLSVDYLKIETSLDRALDEILGSAAIMVRKIFKEKYKNSLETLPRVQLFLSWIQQDMPLSCARIMARAKEIYENYMRTRPDYFSGPVSSGPAA